MQPEEKQYRLEEIAGSGSSQCPCALLSACAAKLSDTERSQLSAYLVEKKFNDKDRIITQGELGLGFYIITKGEVVVTLKNEKAVTAELGRLKEGGQTPRIARTQPRAAQRTRAQIE